MFLKKCYNNKNIRRCDLRQNNLLMCSAGLCCRITPTFLLLNVAKSLQACFLARYLEDILCTSMKIMIEAEYYFKEDQKSYLSCAMRIYYICRFISTQIHLMYFNQIGEKMGSKTLKAR